MISLRQIERHFGITISPSDGGTRLSLYLRIHGADPGQRRQYLERELQNQRRTVLGLNKTRGQERLVHDVFLALSNRLALIELMDGCEGVAAFADGKNLVVTMLPRLSDSFAVVADSFHIRPLLRLPELFLRYVVVTLHGAHVAAYVRDNSGARMLFSFSPPVSEEEGVCRAEKKRRRHFMTLDHAASRVAALGDSTLAIFGPRYLRTRFRKVLAQYRLRPPAFEADADTSLERLIARTDRILSQQAPQSAPAIKDLVSAARSEGRLATDLTDILRAAAIGAIDTFVITTPDALWSEAAVPVLRGQSEWSGTIPWTPRQISCLDDCILDDIGETVLRSGGRVVELPLLRHVGSPAFAVLRWKMPHRWDQMVVKQSAEQRQQCGSGDDRFERTTESALLLLD